MNRILPSALGCNPIRQTFGALAAFVASVVLTSCARFDARPLSAPQIADAFAQRSFADAGLARFLGTNGVAELPGGAWDLERLALAAFYFHPDMDLARARWHMATAGKITAGQRPNPTLAFTPRINSSSIGTGLTPWILGGVLDIPVETMGKRKHRIAHAQNLHEMARFDLANTAWLVRSRVRSGVLAPQAAQATIALAREQGTP